MAARAAPSIIDVARLAGVSPATVSNVLGDRRPVRAASAERVHAAVQALGYETDRAASQLRSRRAKVVAVLVPNLDNPFFTSIIAGLEQAVRAEGYDIIVASSDDDEALERKRLLALLSWRPLGVVILPCTDAFEAREILEGAAARYVVVDRLPRRFNADAVTVDNDHAASLAARHLLELGHERILVAASTLRLANIRERCRGIGRTFQDAGLPKPPVLEAGMTFDLVSERLAGWLDRHGWPTAIVALTNFSTLGVLACLAQQQAHIPNDVSLVGFDDYTWMSVTMPSITAVRQPVELLGRQAWVRLRTRIDGDTSAPARLRLKCDIRIRGSTQRVGVSCLPQLRDQEASAMQHDLSSLPGGQRCAARR